MLDDKNTAKLIPDEGNNNGPTAPIKEDIQEVQFEGEEETAHQKMAREKAEWEEIKNQQKKKLEDALTAAMKEVGLSDLCYYAMVLVDPSKSGIVLSSCGTVGEDGIIDDAKACHLACKMDNFVKHLHG